MPCLPLPRLRAAVVRFLLCFILPACLAPAIHAITFTKIADSTLHLPGMPGPAPIPYWNGSYRNGRAVFPVGNIGGFVTIYKWDNGAFTKIADENFSVLGGGTVGSIAGAPSINEEGDVAFFTRYNGLCIATAAGIVRHPYINTPHHASVPDFRGASVVCAGNSSYSLGSGFQIFSATTASSTTLLTSSQFAPPSYFQTFNGFGSTNGGAANIEYDDGVLAFRADRRGIYTSTSLEMTRIADTTVKAPGSVESFSNFGYPVMRDGLVVFRAEWSSQHGVFAYSNGALTKIADGLTTTPEAPVAMGGFNGVCTNGEWIAFSNSGETRIHLWDGQTIRKVIAAGDILDGKVVTNITISPQSMDGDELFFWADGAWYVASDLVPTVTAAKDWQYLE